MTFHHHTSIDIRWGDMDAYGHVNNTIFFRYLESARFKYFEEVCLPAVEGPVPMIVMVDISCQFKEELRYPAHIVVGSKVSRIGGSSFDVSAEIRQGDKLCATAKAIMVWIDPKTKKPGRIPERVRQAIENFEAQ
ncbi:acyl-CoA thioesterase [Suttonella sp. R2A3]|uniref:acyl-CoA thioesterase n=1 Tax=Suttonella sp. R2A3 TaxID=2908648 RepID=UPI001F28C212|nr:thioesterase family protein [Suttonella sp. R2A3]UJF24164.1 acyl-CoA thioesterase [Suttonella sp. R2A3]